MALERKPFERQTLEQDYVKADVISIKLTHEERQWLEALKRYYQTKYDGTALKNEAFKVFKQTKELSLIQQRK